MPTVIFADLVGSTGIYERLGDEAASRLVTQFTARMGVAVEQHNGRVVKLLGDGLFALFAEPADAVSASIAIQQQLRDEPMLAGAQGPPVQVQIGIESGDVVEIDGDCFGDTVNTAARLADLAGAGQVLTTENVWSVLIAMQQSFLRSIGPMYLRGKAEASQVYRVEWQPSHSDDETMVRRSMFAALPDLRLELSFGARRVRIGANSGKITIGRSREASLTVDDPRVSRVHASLVWGGGQFILSDASTSGTWVYHGNLDEAVVLRRTECILAGNGIFVPGCQRGADDAPVIAFSVSEG